MKNIFSVLMVCASFFVVAQEHGHHHGHKIIDYPDSTEKTLGHSFLDKGNFEFHMRSFFMNTTNRGELMDYTALATGAGMGYYSPSWKNFHFGFSGFFVFQLFEQNLYKADPITNGTNRYEVLLFDMNDFENKHDFDRLEELYLTYERKHFNVVLGRQQFDSPLLNEQDNRMRANLFRGLSVNYHTKNWNLTAAGFDKMTIRGTVDWYGIEESYGVYPFGRNPFGTPSEYTGNVETLGVGILGAEYKNKKGLQVKLWNYYNENVFNLSFFETQYELETNKLNYLFGGQGFYQTAISHGGNENQNVTYILNDEWTYGLGARFGVEKDRHALSLNYLNISDKGRFLFPREWGREQFFASLPRERFEGSGAVNSVMMKYTYHIPEKGLELYVGASIVDHAELDDYEMNKYGIPSFYHLVASMDYKFQGYLEGLDIRLFVVNKIAQNPQEVEDYYRINRVDLWNFNVVLDYRF